MNSRELILLSPHRVPAKDAQMVSDDEAAAFLNGYAALWHPAVLRGAEGLPRVAYPYDHERPAAGQLFAVAESPGSILPDDWERRVSEADAHTFRSTADRGATLAGLQTALGQSLDLPLAKAFMGLGVGYLLLTALFEAMEHENIIPSAELLADVRSAAESAANGDNEAAQRGLRTAAERLKTARESLYPVTIHLLDVVGLAPLTLPSPPEAGGEGKRTALAGVEGTKIALPSAGFLETVVPDHAVNIVASGIRLEELQRSQPELLQALRERIAAESVEVCGGRYVWRDDGLFPLESQLWNLLRGLSVARELLGTDIRTFAQGTRGFHPQLPVLLSAAGLGRAVLSLGADTEIPTFRTAVVQWPTPNGKQIDVFARTPLPAGKAGTFFQLAHHLHQTIMGDQAAALALVHGEEKAAPGYGDLVELTQLAPVLGEWTTFGRFLGEGVTGDQASASTAEEFHTDYLTERTEAHEKHPIEFFAEHLRRRRRLEAIWTTESALVALRAGQGREAAVRELRAFEDKLELGEEDDTALARIQADAADALARRMLRGVAGQNPGYLIFNPCSFLRRASLELDAVANLPGVAGPLKACQGDAGCLRVVVDVPALGFAWIPRSGAAGPATGGRTRLADGRHLRNEFFEAEIDPETGGLRGIWDSRTRVSRLGQQLVFNPGSTARAREIKVTSSGPALGEIVAEGAIHGDDERVLATFRQRFRAWMGRPVLEIRIELDIVHLPEGYPWHSYYGARFAWRDERAVMLRPLNGTGYVTNEPRPQAPDYLELRQGRQNTVLFPCGLPFQQRHGARMIDLMLVPAGESARTFEMALGLDREYPMHTAQGLVTPFPLVAVSGGPPRVGPAGWLFHLDASNLLLMGMRPDPDGKDGVVARFLECGLHGGAAEFRSPRSPCRATLRNLQGEAILDGQVREDTTSFDMSPGDLADLHIEFT